MSNLNYLEFNNPIHITWRKGTPEDPFVDRVEFVKVVNQRVQLLEIPDKNSKVIINGLSEINEDTFKKKNVSSDEFVVDYTNGLVTLHSSQEGSSLVITYKGRGLIAYPSERIYHYDGTDVVENLHNIIENSKGIISDSLEKIKQLKESESKIIIAINNANLATDNAIQSTEDANIATNLALDAHDSTKLIYKPFVQTYDDIETTYPFPKLGWTVQVYDTGIRYRFNDDEWIPIDVFGGNIPNVSEFLDGLMSKEEHIKLKKITTNANEKVIVFILPDLMFGIQNIYPIFPFDGEITEIKVLCGNVGTYDTVLTIEKSGDMVNWSSILSTDITIPSGGHFNDPLFTVSETSVNKNDIFRVNVLNSSDVKNATITIKINLLQEEM